MFVHSITLVKSFIVLLLNFEKSVLTRLWIIYVYTSSQKFGTIRILVLCDKSEKKSAILKMSETYILHNNNTEKLLKNSKIKNDCPINNQVTYPFSF